MKAKDVLVAGITGTTFMTAFSYLVSELDGENFSEPERLGQLAKRLLPLLNKEEKLTTGWTAHYMVGMLFALAYVELWTRGKIKPTLGQTLLLGGVSGILAVAIWKTTFKMHPLPPMLSFNKYYLQLVPAHVVFALFAALGYRLLNGAKASKQSIN
ncbi:hypothetical protein [Mucilaginibacter panaciglaebae]